MINFSYQAARSHRYPLKSSFHLDASGCRSVARLGPDPVALRPPKLVH